MSVMNRLRRACDGDQPIMFDQIEVYDLMNHIDCLEEEIYTLKQKASDDLHKNYQNMQTQVGGILSALVEKVK